MRYLRQQLVIGMDSQKKLENSKITIIGLGAIGSSLAEMAARSGIGKVIIIDRDIVEESNLQRQALYSEQDVGKPKAIVARERLMQINSKIEIREVFDNLDYTNIRMINSDLVLDCSDNMETRMLVNDYCRKNKIAWIYAAGVGNKGYVMNIIPGENCFRCVFEGKKSNETCETNGVLASLTNSIASIQFTQAIKILTGQDHQRGLLQLDIWDNKLSILQTGKRNDCKACNGDYEYLRGKNNGMIAFCGSNRYMIKSEFDLGKIRNHLGKIGEIMDFGEMIIFNNMTFFKNKVLITAKNEKEAKSAYSKYVGS